MRLPFNNRREEFQFRSLIAAALFAAMAGIPVATFSATQRELRALVRSTALAYAQSVITRSDRISKQISSELAALEAEGGKDPCSAASLELMRRIALRSSDIMLVGFERNDRLLCSSFGLHDGGISLGLPDYAGQFSMRRNFRFELAPSAVFNVGERNGWTFFIAQLQPIDIAAPAEVSLATFSVRAQKLRTSHGFIQPQWIEQGLAAREATFIDDGYAVGVVQSSAYASGAIAAVPLSIFSKSGRTTELIATSAAILAGFSIAAWILYLANQYRTISRLSLGRALRRGEFYMVYQPIVDLQTRRWVGVEALMRWRRAKIEIPPDLFFAVAEKSRMMGDFTKRMLSLLAHDAPAIFGADEDIYLSLNLTPSDLEDTGIVSKLQKLANSCEAAPSRFKVEITEQAILDEENAKDTLEAVRLAGIDTVIDDFGTGFSNLKHLSAFTFDFLKIDRIFTAGLESHTVSGDVALHIVKLALSLNIGLIAEGVETEPQAVILLENGVRYGQGWLFSRPQVVTQLTKSLMAFNSGLDQAEI